MSKNIDEIIRTEYEKVKKGGASGKPYYVIAQNAGITTLELYRRLRSLDKSFPLQIEEISFIIENINRIPRWKIFKDFQISESRLQTLASKSGISLKIDHDEYAQNVIKWLIEEELKFPIDDELAHKFDDKLILQYRLTRLKPYVSSLQKENPELQLFPRNFILIDLCYPGQFRPWQFRGLKREYWADSALGKHRLAEALRWLIEEKKGVARTLVPNLKRMRSFLTSRELEYYHLAKAFKLHFKTQDDWIDFTYPENPNKTTRENATVLIKALEQAGRQTSLCEVCQITDSIEIHHILPIFIGGTNDSFNLIALCANHHKIAHKNSFHETIIRQRVKTSGRVEAFLGLFKSL